MVKLMFFLAAAAAYGQTQLDYFWQLKPTTKPVKFGTVLPATCAQGDLFVKTDAPAGLSMYACVTANTWNLETGQSGGTLTIQADGTVLGSRGILNVQAGEGIVHTVADTGTVMDVETLVDTAVVETRSNLESGADLLCVSTSGSGAVYTCLLPVTLGAYTTGMVLRWIPDVTATGGPTTLSVDARGAKPVKLFDGITDPSVADIIAGMQYTLWFDGSSFRLSIPATLPATNSAGRPACDTTQRARLWHILGGTGVKDEVAVCAKDASDQFAWRVLY